MAFMLRATFAPHLDTMAATTSGFLGRAFEKYFFEFSMYDKYWHKHIASKGQYVALRHVTYVTVGLMTLINFNFPFAPSFPTIGMCPSGWKGTFVCEPDKAKALEMYKAWKAGVKYEPVAAHH